MEPENGPLEKEIPNLETILFRFQPLVFGGVEAISPEMALAQCTGPP